MSSNVSILISDSWGVYIPLHFVTTFDLDAWGVSGEEWAIETLKQGPNSENDHYWDAWVSITDKARFLDKDDIEWSLCQDGDLFAVAWHNMTEEEREEFTGC